MLKIKKKRHSKPFVWAPLSKKQLKILSWWADGSPYKDYDGVIADGAVRCYQYSKETDSNFRL